MALSEQAILGAALRPSYSVLPAKRSDFHRLKAPLCIAVTPFPRDLPPPPLQRQNFSWTPQCPHCKAKATNHSCQFPDAWACTLCGRKTNYSDAHPRFADTPQAQSPCWEAFLFAASLPLNLREAPPVTPRDYHCLVFELSEFTYSIFQSVIESMIETVTMLTAGFFTVLVLNAGLTIPAIRPNRQAFSLLQSPDLEDLCLPPLGLCFFDMETDKPLFLRYLAVLRKLPAGFVHGTVRGVVSSLNRVLAPYHIPVTLVLCQLAVDDAASLREFATTLTFRHTTHFDVFAVEPPNFSQSFDPLVDLALFANARLRVCGLLEAGVLPREIVGSLFPAKFVSVVVVVVHSPELRVTDVLGCGVRSSDLAFTLPAVAMDDTVYFFFDYDVGAIKFASPGAQFQVRYYDALGRKIIRTMTVHFGVSTEVPATALDYGVVVAAAAARAAEKYREFGTADAVAKVCAEASEALPAGAAPEVKAGIGRAARLLAGTGLAQAFGRLPAEALRFLVPTAYGLSPGEAHARGPFALVGARIEAPALYVALPGRRGVVLVGEGEDLNAWAEAMRQDPLASAIAAVCTEACVEILAASMRGHPLVRHILACMSGS